jgi:hypothetical protein
MRRTARISHADVSFHGNEALLVVTDPLPMLYLGQDEGEEERLQCALP